MFDGLIELAVAFFAGGGLKYFFDYLKRKRKESEALQVDVFKKTFDDIHNVYSCLNNVSYYCNAQRVIIVKVEDSGSLPSVNSHLRSTILYEVFETPLTSTKTHWQNVKVGKEYIEYIKKVYEDGTVCYKVKDIKQSELKDLHVEHKTGFVCSYMLTKTQRYFLYLSVQFEKEDVKLYPTGRNSIRINMEKLRNIFKNDSEAAYIN